MTPALYDGLVGLDGDSYQRLHAAFVRGDFEAVQRDVGGLGDFPNTSPGAAIGMPLVYAIYHGPIALAQDLLDAGAEPSCNPASK